MTADKLASIDELAATIAQTYGQERAAHTGTDSEDTFLITMAGVPQETIDQGTIVDHHRLVYRNSQDWDLTYEQGSAQGNAGDVSVKYHRTVENLSMTVRPYIQATARDAKASKEPKRVGTRTNLLAHGTLALMLESLETK